MKKRFFLLPTLFLLAISHSTGVYAQSIGDEVEKRAAEQKKLQMQQLQEVQAQNSRMRQASGLETVDGKIPDLDEAPSSMTPGKEGHYVPYDWKIKEMAKRQNVDLHPVPLPTIEAPAPDANLSPKQYKTLSEAAADGINPLAEKVAQASSVDQVGLAVGLFGFLALTGSAVFVFIVRRKRAKA